MGICLTELPELPQKVDTESKWDSGSTSCNSLAAMQRSQGMVFSAFAARMVYAMVFQRI
ncbi:BQ5605_C009g05422 [Microbotryum silenes-dioicae]|uniref:BQ5605_C009g05422 protein n=1 Tax=Microbotryum silenes-dioicae TaxID=796604 RepID=A0A2X0MHR7_9BASI|nr:BQ5605_C009g05422 [Microbotryum silenes-dioicae]